jgi:hypothetical protein
MRFYFSAALASKQSRFHPRTTASFSEAQTPITALRHCRIPLLVGYGTLNRAAVSNEHLH